MILEKELDEMKQTIPWPAGIGPVHDSYHSWESDGCEMHNRCHILYFQNEDIQQILGRLADGKNILLANEMGTGKTVEVIGIINALHPKRIFIACPNNMKLVWRNHIRDFCVWDDIKDELEVAHTALYLYSDVVIMNYEALATKWADSVKKQEWDLVIFDEGHYLKTPSSKRAKAAFGIKGKHQIIMTGSPIVNYPYEIFPLIHYLDRATWPEYGRFEAMFGSRSSERLGRNLNRLNELLRNTIMTRRLKKDVMKELPRKRRQIIEFETTPEIKRLIEEENKLFSSTLNDDELVRWANSIKNESDVAEGDFDWSAIIEALTHTRRYAFEEMARIAHLIGKAKLPFVYEHIENALDTRDKVVVFGHHRDVLTAVHERFAGSALLLGGNANQGLATAQAIERFNDDDNCRVLAAQVSNAQGYSIKGSSTVIFIEEDWVPGVMTQAEDRVHGIGRGDSEAKSCLIQHLTFENSLDTYKAKLTIRKQKSIDRAVGSAR